MKRLITGLFLLLALLALLAPLALLTLATYGTLTNNTSEVTTPAKGTTDTATSAPIRTACSIL